MKTEKPDIRVLCRRCWGNYLDANIYYTPLNNHYKQDCEICGYHEGYEYIEVKKKR